MKSKTVKKIGSIFLLFRAFFSFSGCNMSTNPEEGSGSIEGYALFQNSDFHSGIIVSIEETDALRTSLSTRSISSESISRNLAQSTTTRTDGYYHIDNIEPGTYTVYASSQDSKEGAVSVNITIESGRTVTAADLKLTAVGSISGTALLDDTSSGNRGFIVFIEGTSYMAITDDEGNFTISDVPVGTDYLIVVLKGDYQSLWETVSVSSGNVTHLNVFNAATEEISNPVYNFVWKGSLPSSPVNPQTNWAYYNSVDGISYIYDGSEWQILSQNGLDGMDGADGFQLV